MKGWFAMPREQTESSLWTAEPFSKGQALVDLRGLAAIGPRVADFGGRLVSLERGQLAWSVASLAERWRWSPNKAKRFLSDLEVRGWIRRAPSHVTTVITIVDYDCGIASTAQSGQLKDQLPDQQTGQPTANESASQAEGSSHSGAVGGPTEGPTDRPAGGSTAAAAFQTDQLIDPPSAQLTGPQTDQLDSAVSPSKQGECGVLATPGGSTERPTDRPTVGSTDRPRTNKNNNNNLPPLTPPPPPGGGEGLVEELRRLGVHTAGKVVADALDRGCRPAELEGIIAHYRSGLTPAPSAWGAGGLSLRISNHRPGSDVTAGWPNPSDGHQEALAKKAAARERARSDLRSAFERWWRGECELEAWHRYRMLPASDRRALYADVTGRDDFAQDTHGDRTVVDALKVRLAAEVRPQFAKLAVNEVSYADRSKNFVELIA